MSRSARVSFSVQPFEGTLAIVPMVDETLLTELISTFERENGFEPAAGYGGLIPGWFNYGPLQRYFLGDFDKGTYFYKMGRLYLLGCSCGEVGCWPLTAQISITADSVIWSSFQQPYRPTRDYCTFGPFAFALDQYKNAVDRLCAELADKTAQP